LVIFLNPRFRKKFFELLEQGFATLLPALAVSDVGIEI